MCKNPHVWLVPGYLEVNVGVCVAVGFVSSPSDHVEMQVTGDSHSARVCCDHGCKVFPCQGVGGGGGEQVHKHVNRHTHTSL